ncbi:MAG: alanine racemase [Actinobacteria bacterium]|uniref:Alanine racemase n=1 Tax=Candidatus Fonsibacter lacus TaxID=2576439 RepID=A0A965LKW7_9PROT|nr:alanine racemase [Candidatus Fonsibacter lacus]
MRTLVAKSTYYAAIDYGQIANNARAIINSTGVPLMAVVKADAYGHGLVESARAAIAGGATYLGVAFIGEAVALRDAGVTAPILAWLTPPTENFAQALDFTIDLSVSSLAQLDSILTASQSTGLKPRIHLKVDTGMNRSGALDEFPELVSAIGQLLDDKKIILVGTWSHLACADEPSHPLNREHFDMVRSGLLLYGYFPGGIKSNQFSVRPVMELRADIALVKRVPAGASIGYGASVSLSKDSYIALVPLGYADGIPRTLKNSVEITINGRPYPLIGRVSMDQITVDLGSETTIKAGDIAIFFGGEGAATAEDWAKAAGTISYEILSRIGGRVPRLAQDINPY